MQSLFKGKLAKIGMILGIMVGLELGTANTEYEFTAIANKTGHINRSNEMVMPGAYNSSIERMKILPVPILMMHRMQNEDDLIGWITDAKVINGALVIKARLFNEDAGKRILNKELRYLSIGFKPIDNGVSTHGVHGEQRDIDLMEVSIVTIPADRYAIILDVRKTQSNGVIMELFNRLCKHLTY